MITTISKTKILVCSLFILMSLGCSSVPYHNQQISAKGFVIEFYKPDNFLFHAFDSIYYNGVSYGSYEYSNGNVRDTFGNEIHAYDSSFRAWRQRFYIQYSLFLDSIHNFELEDILKSELEAHVAVGDGEITEGQIVDINKRKFAFIHRNDLRVKYAFYEYFTLVDYNIIRIAFFNFNCVGNDSVRYMGIVDSVMRSLYIKERSHWSKRPA
jgi:hypothetical protein